MRRIKEDVLVSQNFARSLCSLSFAIGRQIGALINRKGNVSHLIVGDRHGIMIPELPKNSSRALRGLRLVHTHLKQEGLSQEDIYDLTLLRLDYITAITMDQCGLPALFYSAHNILPGTSNIEEPCKPGQLLENFSHNISALDAHFIKEADSLRPLKARSFALLAGVYTPSMQAKRTPQDSMLELKELCHTAQIEVVEEISQKRSSLDPITLIGSGKLRELALRAVQKNADMIVFDLELKPAQAKRICELCDLKIIDRTQLILDIFARNATSRDGKLQVELAQLRYLKERLSQKDDNMSRLTGGIGGRGPGETKLEIGRRRVQDRIRSLEKAMKALQKRRSLNRVKRRKSSYIVSIVGYTNAGKSTLLGALCSSQALVKASLFATLEPTTRRLQLSQGRAVLLADTVGFIHELPPELAKAFAATLEELADADLLLHCIDSSCPMYRQKMQAVETILCQMQLAHIPRICVFNKCDLLQERDWNFLPITTMSKKHDKENGGICISAKEGKNLDLLVKKIEEEFF